MDPRIAHVVNYLEAHLADAVGVRELAALTGLSASRFAHLFRDEVGLPPARYLHQLRLRRARELLETGTLAVREVMTQVGFRDPSHFARDFRRYHGVAPSALRGRMNNRGSPPSPAHEQPVSAASETAHGPGACFEETHEPANLRSTG